MNAFAGVTDTSDLQSGILVVVGMLARNEIYAICALCLEPFEVVGRDRNKANDQNVALFAATSAASRGCRAEKPAAPSRPSRGW